MEEYNKRSNRTMIKVWVHYYDVWSNRYIRNHSLHSVNLHRVAVVDRLAWPINWNIIQPNNFIHFRQLRWQLNRMKLRIFIPHHSNIDSRLSRFVLELFTNVNLNFHQPILCERNVSNWFILQVSIHFKAVSFHASIFATLWLFCHPFIYKRKTIQIF